jgi:hypothetical protein
MVDRQAGQSPLRLFNPGIRHPSDEEVELREFGEPLQMRQSGVRDPRAAEDEHGELGQPLQMRQPASLTDGELA